MTYSELVESYIAEFPAILSRNTINLADIVMPHVRKCNDVAGYSVYRYTAAIREITQGEGSE